MPLRPRLTLAERVFRPIFGRWWKAILPVLPVIVGWPIVAFREAVAFDAAHFVEEWIKISVSTIMFYLVVEFVQERRRSELSRLEIAEFRANHLTAPLDRAIRDIDALLSQLEPNEFADASDALLVASRDVEHVAAALTGARAFVGSDSTFREVKADDLQAVALGFSALSTTREWGEASIDDIRRYRDVAAQALLAFRQTETDQ
jgi:hypothetical protein